MLNAKSFKNCTTANTAIIFALTLPTLLLLASIVNDLTKLADARSRLGNSAEMAALAALTTPADDGERFALERFHVLVAEELPDVTLIESAALIDDSNPDLRISSVEYLANVPLFWGGVLSTEAVRIDGRREARDGSEMDHIDVYFLVDRSATMLLPEDPNGSPIFYEDTGCFFACHGVQDTIAAGFENIETRLDITMDAVRSMTNTLAGSPLAPNLTFSLLTFDGSTSVDVGHSDDPAAISNALDTVNPGKATNLSGALRSANGFIGPAGDGSSADNRRQILIFISDADHRRASEPWNAGLCGDLKNRGVELYTLYLPVRPFWLYRDFRESWPEWVDYIDHGDDGTFKDGLHATPALTAQERMSSCSSGPEYAFLANDEGDIDRAVNHIMGSIVRRTAYISD